MTREYYCAKCGWTHPVPSLSISAGTTLTFGPTPDARLMQADQGCPVCDGPVDVRPVEPAH